MTNEQVRTTLEAVKELQKVSETLADAELPSEARIVSNASRVLFGICEREAEELTGMAAAE